MYVLFNCEEVFFVLDADLGCSRVFIVADAELYILFVKLVLITLLQNIVGLLADVAEPNSSNLEVNIGRLRVASLVEY